MPKYLPIFLFLIFSLPLMGQDNKNVDTSLENPNNSMYVHLYYLQTDSYKPSLAAKALFPEGDSTTLIKKSIQLKQILDGAGLFVHFNKIPTNPDYIDTLTKRAIFTPFPEEMPEIYLEKTNGRWYYSKETVSNIPRLHKKVFPFGADLLLNSLPKMGQTKILGMALWQYLGLLILMSLGLLSHLLLSRILNPIIRRMSRSKSDSTFIRPKLISRIARLASVLIILRLIKLFLPVLLLPVTAGIFAINVIKIFSTILIVLIAFGVLDIFIAYIRRFTQSTKSKMDEQLVPIIKRSVQAVIVIGGIAQLLQIFDINVTALIAGLSIGGLALALAAQDTVKNLIGSAMIFVDQPFQIGDFVEYGGMTGTILEVGFRSTRIQEADSSIISIPNGAIANAAITNKGVRIFRLFNINIGLTYDTPVTLLKIYIEGLKKIIEIHPKARTSDSFIYLNSLGDSSINIMFRVPLEVTDYGSELQVKEELLFSIIELANEMGVRFAFPSTTLYMEEFPGRDSMAPTYETNHETLKRRFDAFVESKKTTFN
ncbi:MAG: mechanosensitive ion channel family protein [Saprospiraceae bacterium]|nr:mechanosensitive ion channel family protein [Saprospiraceae bacterium]MCB9324803.1 mechanosensitive ion channel family protein [Lewinellaceae bacterium]